MAVTHIFMFCQSSVLNTVISFTYKDQWCKGFFQSLSTLIFIESNLKTRSWNKRSSPWRPDRMKSIIQKRIIPVRTQSQDEKFLQNLWMAFNCSLKSCSRPCEVWRVRQGHNICGLCSFLVELSSCRVTYENCNKSSFFKSCLSWADGFKKFQWYWVKELLLYNRKEVFLEDFH